MHVDEISPSLWPKMEKCVEHSPLADYYKHLSEVAETSLGAVGFRKVMEMVYVWVMMPVMGTSDSGGNAVALEVTSETGHATYLFWVMPRESFPTATRERFVQEAEKVVRDLNESVIATGFRREPIYLSEDQLNTSEYSKYLYAAGHLEPLKLLRERFFARVMHNTVEQWRTDFADALLFNTTKKDDSARWSKNVLDFIEGPQEQVTGQTSSAATSGAAAIFATPSVVVQSAVPPPAIQPLNAESAPIGYMAERSVTLSRMEGDERGNVKLMLHDSEFDYDIWLMISGDDAAKLGAFPGAKLKIGIQKA